MPIYYSDPYKENKFGSIYGEMAGDAFSVYFDEARFYRKDEKTLVLAGRFSRLPGALRKFQPDKATLPVLLTLDIHKEDYEVNHKKDDGSWEKVTRKATEIEKFLYEQIDNNPIDWRLHPCDESVPIEQRALKGFISLFDSPSIVPMLNENPKLECHAWKIEYVKATEVSEWSPKAVNANYGKGGGNFVRVIDESEKIAQRESKLTELLKKAHESVKNESDLFGACQKLAPLYKEDPDAFDLYFKFLALVCR